MTRKLILVATIALFLSVVFRSIAFVFAKLAANHTAGNGVGAILLSPMYWAELGALLIQASLWVFTLRHLRLSVAYPVTALVFVLNLGWSWFLFNEEIVAFHIIGYGLIMVGVALSVPSGKAKPI